MCDHGGPVRANVEVSSHPPLRSIPIAWPKRLICERRCCSGLSSLIDADLRQPLQPTGQVPVPVAEELHRRRQQDRADDRGVDEHSHAQAQAELLPINTPPEGEGA